jgi:hypothetical protein
VNVSPRVFLWISLSLHALAGAAVYGKLAPSHTAATSPPADVSPTVSPPSSGPEALFKGNTFEIPIDVPAVNEAHPDEPSPDTSADSTSDTSAASTSDEPSRSTAAIPTRARRARAAHEPSGVQRGTGEGDEGAGTVFGALGDRASIDLATAFTRGFPQAASADPAWMDVAYGPAGEATVVLEIDATGGLVDSRIEGAPSPAFRSGLVRTLALIHARTFTAKSATTRLHVTARVSPDEVHDGLHGEVFAIGGSFAAAEGQAFFALAIGRRIDLRVTE